MTRLYYFFLYQKKNSIYLIFYFNWHLCLHNIYITLLKQMNNYTFNHLTALYRYNFKRNIVTTLGVLI